MEPEMSQRVKSQKYNIIRQDRSWSVTDHTISKMFPSDQGSLKIPNYWVWKKNLEESFSIHAKFSINAKFSIHVKFSLYAKFSINAKFSIYAKFSILP